MSMTVTVGDTRPTLTATLTSGSEPVNLAGAAVEWHIVRPAGLSILVRAATIVNAAGGTISMEWLPTDLAAAGVARLEAQVTWADGGVQTFGPVPLVVEPALA